MFDLKLHSY